MSVIIVLIGVGVLLLLIAGLRLNAFLAFLVVSFGIAMGIQLVEGLPVDPTAAASSIKTGIGNILGSLVPILGLGAMLGKLVAESGGAQRLPRRSCKPSGKEISKLRSY